MLVLYLQCMLVDTRSLWRCETDIHHTLNLFDISYIQGPCLPNFYFVFLTWIMRRSTVHYLHLFIRNKTKNDTSMVRQTLTHVDCRSADRFLRTVHPSAHGHTRNTTSCYGGVNMLCWPVTPATNPISSSDNRVFRVQNQNVYQLAWNTQDCVQL